MDKIKVSVNNGEVAVCKRTKLRLIEIKDAEFILFLRLNNKLNKYLSPVDNDIKKQKEWLINYKKMEKNKAEYYFIITSLNNSPLGAVRLYDFIGDSFCWGSWVVQNDSPKFTAIESVLSVYEFAFYKMGFHRAHFDVRKENLKVIKFHKGFGAKEISSDQYNIYFNFLRDDYEKTKKKYRKFLI